MADEHGQLTGKILGISAAAAVGGFLFGFDTAVINGAVDALSGTKAGFDLSPTLTGIAVSSALLGCTIGAMFAGKAADRFGRIRVMVVAAILFAVSSVLSGLAFSVWDLILWRVVAGLGVGIASVVVPAYIAEVSPSSARGRLGSLQQLAIAFGIFGAFLSNLALASAAGTPQDPLWFGVSSWRWMLIAGVVPSIAYGLLALKLPESPRYLVAAGRAEEARRVLADTVDDPDPAGTVSEIQASLDHDHRPRLADLRSPSGGLKPVVWVAIVIAFHRPNSAWTREGHSPRRIDSLLQRSVRGITKRAANVFPAGAPSPLGGSEGGCIAGAYRPGDRLRRRHDSGAVGAGGRLPHRERLHARAVARCGAARPRLVPRRRLHRRFAGQPVVRRRPFQPRRDRRCHGRLPPRNHGLRPASGCTAEPRRA